MKHPAAHLLSSLLAVPLVAQGFHATLPAGYLSRGGDSYLAGVSYPFDPGPMRYQEVHTDWRGQKKTVSGMAFRQAWGRQTNTTAVTRIHDLLVRVGYGDLAKFGNSSFDGNFTSGRTVALGKETPSGVTPVSVKLPDWTRQDPKWSIDNPAPFSLRLIFAAPFLYDGKADLVWDVETVKASTTGGRYNCDRASVGQGDHWTFVGAYMPEAGPQGCQDSAVTGKLGAYVMSHATSFSKTYMSPAYRDYTRIAVQSFSTAPNATVIHAVGLPLVAGIDVGARCNRLHVDTGLPHVLRFQLTVNSPSGYSPPTVLLSRNAVVAPVAGVALGVQAAWSDSKSGAFALSTGSHLRVPGYPRPRNSLFVFQQAGQTTLQGPYDAGSVITGWW